MERNQSKNIASGRHPNAVTTIICLFPHKFHKATEPHNHMHAWSQNNYKIFYWKYSFSRFIWDRNPNVQIKRISSIHVTKATGATKADTLCYALYGIILIVYLCIYKEENIKKVHSDWDLRIFFMCMRSLLIHRQ